MPVKAKFSKNYWAMQKRIQRLPELFIGVMESKMKKDATGLIDEFQDGIRDNSFRLENLKDGTVKRKRQLGFERPKTPLYGEGDNKKKNSYINMMRIRKVKNGFKVRPSVGMHYSGDISLRTLFYVHNFGTIIKAKNGSMIRIPPRPAFTKAFGRMMRKRKMRENTDKVKDAMLTYIRDAKIGSLEQIEKQNEAGLAKFDEE